MKIDFERDSIAESRYTQLRNDYDFAQKTYESIVKGGKRNIPDVSGIGLK
ncbi:MAG: hypothetical protein LBI53_05050 [Candidatus Peribacteria bacterium]|jgi:hypothetical protein|nr:hypothetical protein [Candidatus Peribacteria bacterium]